MTSAALLCALLLVAQEPAVPANQGWVTDLAGLLQPGEEQALEALCESYRAGSGQEIAVLLVPDLGGRPIEELALSVARAWKIGDRETSSGALLVVARDEHELRIEVGRGLEGKLTDSISGRIIRDVIVPEFRAQRFHAGLTLGLEAIHAALGGDYGPVERTQRGRDPRQGIPVALVVMLLIAFLARRKRGLHGRQRGSSSALPWLLAASLGHAGRSSGGRVGGFSGGSFGGFGGGGGFSGGGASGRW